MAKRIHVAGSKIGELIREKGDNWFTGKMVDITWHYKVRLGEQLMEKREVFAVRMTHEGKRAVFTLQPSGGNQMFTQYVWLEDQATAREINDWYLIDSLVVH